MAFVYLKRRRDPIEISNERAIRLRVMWLGDENGNNKADPNTAFTIGGVSCDLSELKMIDIPDESPKQQRDYEAEHRIEMQKALSTPVEIRAMADGLFQLSWFMRSGMKTEYENVPREVLNEVHSCQLDWLKKNTHVPFAPPHVTEHILVRYFGKKSTHSSLADRFRVSD